MSRVYLSPPDVGPTERELLLAAFDANWIAPVGPDLTAFEDELAAFVGARHVAALSSGTAALHLALVLLGVGPDDEVVLPSLTFAATASAVAYTGARPRFVDSEPRTWNLDPDLLAEELADAERAAAPPKAVIVVDLYGQCAEHEAIAAVCDHHGVPIIEDAAEALGASRNDRPAGTFGTMAALSFNGNKIMTTSGGGALLSADGALVERARYLATQARQPALHYEHTELGYNYRLSNLLAAVGRGQLRHLSERIGRRHEINARYRAGLAGLEGIGFLPESPDGVPNHWLTVITVDPAAFGAGPADLVAALEAADIEARPAWKPMHRQPLYRDAPMRGGAVADAAFATGLCLPSGSSLPDADLDRVVEIIRATGG